MDEDRKNRLRLYPRLKALESERKKGWESHWKELSYHFLPRRSRFLDAGERTNDGDEKNKLNDDTGVLCVRTLASGMQGGLTSPVRPWFSLTLQNEELAKQGNVKLWLDEVERRMLNVFGRSNFYDQIHMLYMELGVFGTSVMLVEEDDTSIIRCRTLTVGEYCLDVDAAHRVNTLYRRVRMTARQILEAWPDTCPDQIRHIANRPQQDWITLLHAVEPNKDYREGTDRTRGNERRFRSTYILIDKGSGTLEDDGYYEFPALCPRWNTTASDIYGSSPAMDGLADCRMLQKMAEDGFIGLELAVRPPLINATGSEDLDPTPGAINSVSSTGQGKDGIYPMYQVKPDLNSLEAAKEMLRQQIRRMLYNDLFLMVTGADKRMTATEVDIRQSEKMLLLGPVVDRLRSELFQPLIERTYGIMDRNGYIPPAPQELDGQELKVEFISILAQAQKAAGLNGLLQTAAVAAQYAPIFPEAADVLNIVETIKSVAEMNNVPQSLINPDEVIAEKAAQRQKQMEQMQMMQMMQAGAEMANKGAGAIKDAGLVPQPEQQPVQ